MRSTTPSTIRSSTRLFVSLYVTAALALAVLIVLQRFSVAPASLPTKKLQEFPLQIGPWEGAAASLDPDIVAALEVDDWMLRSYTHASRTSIWLYIGYYAKSFKPHSPLDCFPGQGWKISQRNTQLISLQGVGPFFVHKLVVQKGLEQHLVLYWNQSGERVFTELDLWQKRWTQILEEYWSRLTAILHQRGSRTDRVFVRISAPILHNLDDTLSHEIAFIQAVFPLLAQHLALHDTSR